MRQGDLLICCGQRLRCRAHFLITEVSTALCDQKDFLWSRLLLDVYKNMGIKEGKCDQLIRILDRTN